MEGDGWVGRGVLAGNARHVEAHVLCMFSTTTHMWQILSNPYTPRSNHPQGLVLFSVSSLNRYLNWNIHLEPTYPHCEYPV